MEIRVRIFQNINLCYQFRENELRSGKKPTTDLVTQDFTQITFEGGFSQDLIVCIYTHNSKGKNGLDRCYRHFVEFTKDKNDIAFVVGCWKVLLVENQFDRMKNIKI